MDNIPLTAKQLAKLREDAKDLKATARRKGLTLDSFDEQRESFAARFHFDLGCWLHYYSRKVGMPDGLQDRIACAKRIFLSGVISPGYDFFTIFDFGERDFDTIFEMGDSIAVVDALRSMIPEDQTGRLIAAFKYFNWPVEVETCAA